MDNHSSNTLSNHLESALYKELIPKLFHKLNNKLSVAMANIELISLERNKSNLISNDLIKESDQALKELHSLMESFNYLSSLENLEKTPIRMYSSIEKIAPLFKHGVIPNTSTENLFELDLMVDPKLVKNYLLISLALNLAIRRDLPKTELIKMVFKQNDEVLELTQAGQFGQLELIFTGKFSESFALDSLSLLTAEILKSSGAETAVTKDDNNIASLILKLPLKVE